MPSISLPVSQFRTVVWEVAPLGGGTNVAGLVLAGDRLVAVGTNETAGLAWYSDDAGDTWTEARFDPAGDPPREGAVARPREVAASGGGLLAIGLWTDPASGEVLGTAAWTSADGLVWGPVELLGLAADDFVVRLTGTDDGFYAQGFANGGGLTSWWYSRDGASWLAVEMLGLEGQTISPAAVAVGPQLNVLVGAGGNDRDASPAAWISNTWVDWTEAYVDADHFGVMQDVTAHGDLFYAVGSTWDQEGDAGGEESRPAAWVTDGQLWQPFLFEAEPGSSAYRVAANRHGAVFMVAPREFGSHEAWFLPSGSATPARATLPFAAQALVALDDRFVAIGPCLADTSCEGLQVAVGQPTE